ncbi:MAG TPA: cation diffusion facilitator family transporter [Acidimicrobiia bacterium]|nr:cation diffusion facilitator family transporter [Acidimicrobiia bacterium]
MAGSESRSVVVLALIANSLIAVLKFVAAGISGSTAMLAEGFHSVADSGNQLFLLRGTSASKFSPSVRFAFGRGKEVYFWSFMVAVVLFVGGGVVAILEGWERIRHPEHHEGGIVLNLIVLGLAAAFEIFIAFRPAIKEFNRRRGGRAVWRSIRESKDPTLVVVLFEDTVAVLGVTIAAAGLVLAEVTGASQWDGAASIVIGVMLTATAWVLAVETKGLLLGESASRLVRSDIRSATLSVKEVESVERLLTMHLGPDEILVNLDITVEDGLSGDEVERIVDHVERSIRSTVPEATRIFVEVGEET